MSLGAESMGKQVTNVRAERVPTTAEVNHGELLQTEINGGDERAVHHDVEVASHRALQVHAS